LRYVDDIFAVFPDSSTHHSFLEHLNNLHTNLAFTVEVANGPFPFFDIEIDINGDGVDTWVFRKKTHTGVMLNFNAIVPNVWKVGLIRCLLNRAKQICSSDALFSKEVCKLKKMFLDNGYPKIYFERAYEKFLSPSRVEVLGESENEETLGRRYTFGIPYVGTASREYKKKITGLIKEHLDVDISAYFTSCKVGSFFSLKSKTPFALKACVVYKFQCLNDADNTYIGESKRHIVTRANDHLNPKGKITEIKSHIFACDTCKTSRKSGQLTVENFSILKQCKNEYKTRIAEALLIKKLRPRLNKQQLKGTSYFLRLF
jgi:hypothetical protein